MGWRFLQISDVHLGASLANYSPEIGALIRQASRQAFQRCLQLAHEQSLSAVLISGGLVNMKGINPEGELSWAYEQIAAYPQLYTFVIPGASDAITPDSPYTSLIRPPNLHVFTSADWEILDLGEVTLTAQATHDTGTPLQFRWSNVPRPAGLKFDILALKGHLRGAADGTDRLPGAVLSPEDLALSDYDYCVLSPLRAQQVIRDHEDRIIGAYAGPPQPLGFEELGPGGCLSVEVDRGGTNLEYHQTAVYNLRSHAVEFPPPYASSYKLALRSCFEALQADFTAKDIVRLKLSGQLPQSQQVELARQLGLLRTHVGGLEEPDTKDLELFAGVNQLSLLPDTELSQFLARCSQEESQTGADLDHYALVRRIGWSLLAGQGLPGEVS